MKKKAVSCFLLTSFLLYLGCYDTVQLKKEDVAANGDGGTIVVVTTANQRFEFDKGRYGISGDSLLGTGVRQLRAPLSNQRFQGAIALSDIAFIEAKEFSPAKTILLAGGIGLAIAGLVALNNGGSEDSPPPPPPSGGGQKFSCPFIYTFDGSRYHFESETFAGSVFKGLERTTYDQVYHLVPVDNVCHLKLVNARNETEYVNELKLIVIDHPRGTTIVADKQGTMHTITSPVPPLSCVGFDGRNTLAQVMERDGSYWQSTVPDLNGIEDRELKDGLILEFRRPAGAQCAKLVVNGKNTRLGYFALAEVFQLKGADKLTWYRQLESDPAERAKFARWVLREGMLHVSLWKNDAWVEQTTLSDVGPGIAKDQIALLDIKGTTGDVLKVRLESTVDLWRIDQVFVDYSADGVVLTAEVSPQSAITEHGQDVRDFLKASDGKYYTTITDQFADITFVDPPLCDGMHRSYVVKTGGFYYQWLTADGPAQDKLMDRILREPAFGARYLLPQWLKVRSTFEGS